MAAIAKTPEPPYYAVIFTSDRSDGDNGYAAMAEEMVMLAERQPGFLGVESVRDATGAGITVSYWQTLEDVAQFKAETRHRVAQRLGRECWYRAFGLRVCRVERDSFF